jgi:CheY-like chemotaxis protein
LGSEGYEVRSAESVTKGYLTYLKFRPNLVLTDVSMGGETGIELVGRIRIHEPEIPTIYMTGDTDRYRSELAVEKHSSPFTGIAKTVFRTQPAGFDS